MPATYTFGVERRSERRPLSVRVRIQRHDGTSADGQCVDASDDGFGIAAEIALEVGEIVRLTIGRSATASTFAARVIWQQGSRIGLFCVGTRD